jgi:phytoene desaturase
VSRVLVVGAGMGGLAVSARLATLGHQVTVLERAERPGGKLACFRRDGFVFDTGPSLLTLPAVYRDLFLKTAVRRAGASLESNVPMRPVEPAFSYRFADGTRVDLPDASRSGAAQALDAAMGGDAGEQWTRLADAGAAIWQATRTSFLSSPIDGPVDLLRRAVRVRDVRVVAPFTSLRSYGRKRLRDPRLRQMLDRYATYAGSDPRRAPAALAVIPYLEQAFGIWHVEGGLHRLADALYQRCLERGVAFRFSSDVVGVTVVAGRIGGARLAGGEPLTADVVVSDVDARHLYAELMPPGSTPRALAARLTGAAPSIAPFSVLLALRGPTPNRCHHTVLFPADYDAEFDALFGPSPQPVPDPSVYVCAPPDPTMAPSPGYESWSILVNAAPHVRAASQDAGGPGWAGVDWRVPGLAEAYADQLLAVLARRGLDVRDRVLWRHVRTPADLEDDVGAPGGAIYGTSSNGPRAAFLRPANRGPVPGLFLVGGSAHPGGGLPLVGLSAEIVAGLVGPA